MASSESRKKAWEDLNITSDEIERLSKALKNEEFRKLFVEYAEEISDPDNRRQYEEEIRQLEDERGMDVTFINPEPGYVLKTTVDGDKKAFINICSNLNIEKPISSKQCGPDGTQGLQWSIPHSFAPPRDDIDKSSNRCRVYDVVFHPDTLRMAQSNARFKKMIEDTALDGIMRSFNVTLDKKNCKFPQMTFKGTPQATVIRKKKPGSSEVSQPPTTDNDGPLNFPYPYDNKPTDVKSREKEEEIRKREEATSKVDAAKADDNSATTPKYSIVHRSELDIQEYRDAPDALTSTRPNELVVTVDLPLLKSAASVDLDILQKKLTLISTKPAAYKLELNLPYPVDENNGSAKFDKSKRKLTITLPVIPDPKKDGLVLDLAPMENREAKPEGLPDLIPANVDQIDSKPLIEVLSSDEIVFEPQQSIDSGDLPDSSGEGDDSRDEKCIWSSEDVGDEKFVPKVAYSLPEYDFSQDDQTISCILNVKKVSVDSVSKSYSSDKRTVTLKFVSVGAGGFPTHYSLCVQFPDVCTIAPEQTSVDVTEENVILLLLKEKSCRSEWSHFNVGIDEAHFEEKLFMTEKSLGECLDILTAEASKREVASSEKLPPFKVAELNEEKLVIEVGGTPFLSDSDTDASPREIEVVHQKITPNIQSILKQRTISESSDELSSSCNGKMSFSRESSRQDSWSASENEIGEGRMRKSVSFNEHIDMTTFKPTQAVTTMKTALKSKRRRQRKKEQKQERRRRHSSTGSENSSSEDVIDTPPIGGPCSKKGTLQTQKEETKSELALVQKDVDRTSDAKNKGKGGKYSDDKLRTSDSGSNGPVGGKDLGNGRVSNGGGRDNTESAKVSRVKDGLKSKIKVISKEAASDDEDDDIVDRTHNGSNESEPPAKPDTILGWEEKASVPDPYEAEHKTQCAFNFSNTMMYDLDID